MIIRLISVFWIVNVMTPIGGISLQQFKDFPIFLNRNDAGSQLADSFNISESGVLKNIFPLFPGFTNSWLYNLASEGEGIIVPIKNSIIKLMNATSEEEVKKVVDIITKALNDAKKQNRITRKPNNSSYLFSLEKFANVLKPKGVWDVVDKELVNNFNVSLELQRIYDKLLEMKVDKNRLDLYRIGNRLAIVAQNLTNKGHVRFFIDLLQNDGSFSDIDYVTDNMALRTHGKRLGRLVNEELNENKNLSLRTIAAFNYIVYKAPPINSTNWWLHIIGVPTILWRPLVLAEHQLESKFKNDYLKRFFKETKIGSVWNAEETSGRHSGGNFGPRAVLGLVEAYIEGTLDTRFEEIKRRLHQEVVAREPFEGNGMRADGCLHQHNMKLLSRKSDRKKQPKILSQVYNNNYGKEFLKNVGLLLWLVHDTSFSFGEAIEEGVFSSFFDCQQWLFRGKTVEPTSTGRFIDSGKLVTKVGSQDAVKRTLEYFHLIGRRSLEVEGALHRYNNNIPDKKFALIGNRHFFNSDLMAHQRPNYMASVRLLSRRTMRPETVKQNPEGYFQGDGFTSVIVTGKEFGSPFREVFQVYDWARVPGSTCQYTTAIPKIRTGSYWSKHFYNDHNFVGGVSNGYIGATTMVYSRPTVPLKAKKSWFFLNDLIVCMGSGIHISSNLANKQQVSTTLAQVEHNGIIKIGKVLLPFNYFTLSSNISHKWSSFNTSQHQWIHHDHTGYVIWDPNQRMNVKVSRKFIKKQSIDLFSLWLDHGVSPRSESYAYAILPSWTVGETKTFSRNPSVQILNRTNHLHSICYSNKVMMAVLFGKGCIFVDSCLSSDVNKICSDKAAMFIVSDLKSQFNLNNNVKCPTRKIFKRREKKRFYTRENSANAVYYRRGRRINSKNLSYKSTKFDSKIQINVADPSQTLTHLKLQIKSFKFGTIQNLIPLPAAPKQGDTVTFCCQT